MVADRQKGQTCGPGGAKAQEWVEDECKREEQEEEEKEAEGQEEEEKEGRDISS